jgi:hypothetical protein
MTQYLGLNIPDEIADAIADRIAITKETKTDIVINALSKDLGIAKPETLIGLVKSLDVRVANIEARLGAN